MEGLSRIDLGTLIDLLDQEATTPYLEALQGRLKAMRGGEVKEAKYEASACYTSSQAETLTFQDMVMGNEIVEMEKEDYGIYMRLNTGLVLVFSSDHEVDVSMKLKIIKDPELHNIELKLN